jgi:hypothetical protein
LAAAASDPDVRVDVVDLVVDGLFALLAWQRESILGLLTGCVRDVVEKIEKISKKCIFAVDGSD